MDSPIAKLTLEQRGGVPQEFELARPRVLIGRGLTNDVVLQDARVSRAHARLDCDAAGCTLVDLGSPNGTWVNGRRITKILLTAGDNLVLGDSHLTFSAGPTTSEPAVTVLETAAAL